MVVCVCVWASACVCVFWCPYFAFSIVVCSCSRPFGFCEGGGGWLGLVVLVGGVV